MPYNMIFEMTQMIFKVTKAGVKFHLIEGEDELLVRAHKYISTRVYPRADPQHHDLLRSYDEIIFMWDCHEGEDSTCRRMLSEALENIGTDITIIRPNDEEFVWCHGTPEEMLKKVHKIVPRLEILVS